MLAGHGGTQNISSAAILLTAGRDHQGAAPRRQRLSDVEMAEYARQVVDSLPTLTEEQRDMLALLFGSRRK